MKIDNNYRIVFDEYNVILQYYDNRIKEKRDGTTEEYEFQQNTFHGTVKNALTAYMNKKINGSSSAEDFYNRIQKVEEVILNLSQQIENHENKNNIIQ